jgi:hypothetical protein
MLALGKVAVHAGHKVLFKVDNSISLIVGNLQGILAQQLRPRPIHLSNIITLIINDIKTEYLTSIIN